MVTAVRSAWREVPPYQVRQFAARALEEVPALAQDILREIRHAYPQLPVVPDEFGESRALVGIRQSLEHFVAHLTAGPDRPHVHPRVFQEFGRGEGLQGRSLTSSRPSTGWASGWPGGGSPRSASRSRSRHPRCTSSPSPATSTWTGWSPNPYAATPRPPPARPVNGCGCNGA